METYRKRNERNFMKQKLSYACSFFFVCIFILPVFAKSDREKLNDWETGISIAGYNDQAFEKISAIKAAGFDCLQLSLPANTKPPMTDEQKIAWLKKFRAACKTIDLDIEYVHVPFSGRHDISQRDDAKREAFCVEVIRLMDWNKYIDADIFVIHPSAEPIANEQRPERIRNCIASLKRLNAEAKKRDIRLAVENLPRTCLCNTSAEANMIIAQAGPDMRLCFDTNHLLKETPEQFLANFKGKIAAIHVSDYDYIDEKHWIPYQGKCDWNSIVKELLRHGYDEVFMFESSRLNDGTVAPWSQIIGTWQRMKKEYK